MAAITRPVTKASGTITSPGNDPLVITVGAMNTEGTPQGLMI